MACPEGPTWELPQFILEPAAYKSQCLPTASPTNCLKWKLWGSDGEKGVGLMEDEEPGSVAVVGRKGVGGGGGWTPETLQPPPLSPPSNPLPGSAWTCRLLSPCFSPFYCQIYFIGGKKRALLFVWDQDPRETRLRVNHMGKNVIRKRMTKLTFWPREAAQILAVWSLALWCFWKGWGYWVRRVVRLLDRSNAICLC